MIRVGCAFALDGVAATVWPAATPALAARFDTSVGGLGITFVALALGGILGPRAAPRVIARLGAGRTTVAAGFAIAAGLALHAVPQTLGWFVVAQFLAGLADGVSDVSMNVEAVAVDAQARIPIVNRLHTVWSMGAVAGGLLGALLAATGTSVSVHMLVGAATVALLNLGTLPLARARDALAPSVGPPLRRWWHSRALVRARGDGSRRERPRGRTPRLGDALPL